MAVALTGFSGSKRGIGAVAKQSKKILKKKGLKSAAMHAGKGAMAIGKKVGPSVAGQAKGFAQRNKGQLAIGGGAGLVGGGAYALGKRKKKKEE